MDQLSTLPRGELCAALGNAAAYLGARPKVKRTPYPEYDPSVMAVLGSLKADADYLSHYEAIKGKPIAEYTLAEIATMYTFIKRGERFCDGHIASYVENGTLYELVMRQRKLLGVG